MTATSPTTTISGIDISLDSGSSAADFVTKDAVQAITATLSAPLLSGELLEASTDGGANWTNVSAISGAVSGTAVTWLGVTLAGSSSIQFRVSDGGNTGPVSSQAYLLDAAAPLTTVSGVDISADTGSSASDFITKAAGQTVTATLSAPLAAGEILQASVDNGANWTAITSSVSGTSVNWTGVTLRPGADVIQLRVTDAAGNNGAASSTSYDLDTVAPTRTVSGIGISADTGASSTDEITKVASQTITATLSSALGSGEVLELSVDGGVNWSDITSAAASTSVSVAAQLLGGANSIQMRVTDTAGNSGSVASQNYTLLTVAPDTTVSAIAISADTGTSASDFDTRQSSQVVSATLSSTLRTNEILQGSVDGGANWTDITGSVSGTAVGWSTTILPGSNAIQLRVADQAGNTGSVASTSYVLDTVAPLTSAAGIDISNDTGASASDFRTNASAQTVTATLSSTLAPGDILEGSVDSGANWTDITASVSGSAVSWAGATLAGSSAVQFRVKDLAGNVGPVSGQAYVLDTVSTTVSGIAISTDTGSSTSDLITNTASQTVTATLGSSLEAGEILEGSADGGATWTDITSTAVTGTAVSWVGATLAGSSSIKLRTTDIAGNTSVATQNYVLDTSPATTTASAIDISSDTGSSANDFITKDDAQTITATLSTALVAGEILEGRVTGAASWTDITGNVSGTTLTWAGQTLVGSDTIELRVTDVAGNVGVVSSQNYDLDQAGTAVSGIDISDDTGNSANDFITRVSGQTITATLGAPLTTGDLVEGSIDNGTTWTDITSFVNGTTVTWAGQTLVGSNTIRVKVTDAAGNVGTIASQAYEIDTTAATTTVSAISISADTGALTTDLVTNNPGPQTISATLSAPLTTGEILEGSLDGGLTWTDVTSAVSAGTAIAWAPVTLSAGIGDIRLRVTDGAGNVGIPSIQAYELDTTAPLTTVSVTSISNDSGTSASDFLTNIPGQNVTVAFSAPLAVGEFVEVSVDGGTTWSPRGGTAGATTHSFGVTLSGTPGTVTTSSIQVRVTDVAGNGGPPGSQNYVLDRFAPVTTVSNIDISADTGSSSSDFETKQAAQTVTATLSSLLDPGDILQGSVDGGANWTDITNQVSGKIVTWTGTTLSGNSAIVLRVVDAAGNIGSASGQSYVLDTVGTTTVSGIGLSADTGSSASDLITNVAAQTVTATLSSPLLAGEILEGSVDGGANWTTISGGVGSTAVNWTGVTLSGSSSIQLRVTDVAGNVGVAGIQSYVLDTTAATTTVSQIDISDDLGTLNTDFLTNEASQDITATLSTALLAGEVLQGSVDGGVTWTDITSSVSGTTVSWMGATLLSGVQSVTRSSIEMRVLDVAGNAGTSSTQAYVLDTEYTTISGIGISADSGTSSSDYLTRDAAQTVTATLSAPLVIGEVLELSVDGGVNWTNVTSSVSGTAVSASAVLASGSNSLHMRLSPDAAGNSGFASQAYELDTTPPATTLSDIDISSDSGTSASDFITNVAAQAITATLSSALATGEILQGSLDGGANWSDISGMATGTAVTWSGVTLTGSSTVQLRVMDAAGNTGSVASQAYDLDTAAPTTTLSAIDIASDSGASAADFVTNVASQTVTATLSSALATGEILEGSVDGGASWSNITAAVSGTAVSWTAATLSGSSSIQLRVTDAAGNTGSAANRAYVLDTTAPGVSGIDIASDSGTLATDFLTNVASQIVTATLNTALAAGEVLEGSVDGGTTWTDITASVTGGTSVSWSGVMLSGSSTIQLRVTDMAGNVGSTSQAYVLDTVAPTTTLSGVDISADTGSSAGDFVTKVASQTVTATLSSALVTGEILQGSLDGGASWSDITASASGTAVSWAGATLSGTSSIQLRVMDAAGNDGAAFGQVYILDTVAPTTTLSGLAISTDTGTSTSDRLTKVASQTVTATLSSALASGEVLEGSVDGGATWSDVTSAASGTAVSWTSATLAVGSNSISLRVTDAAGNSGSASGLSYELDVTAPTTTLSTIDIASDTGRSASDFTTNVASQTITATLSSALVSGEVLEGSVDGGTNWSNITAAASGTAVSWTGATLSGSTGIQLRVTDGAGNSGSVASQAYILDTTAPTTTLSGIDISSDSGTSASDFLTKAASQAITATLSSGLAPDEILEGSVDNGASWSDITSAVIGTSVNWTGATLSGSSSIKLRVTDIAGNNGSVAIQAYELDTTAPTKTLSGIDISSDSGTSASDFITNVASQRITATLSSALASGEILQGSVDNGVNWSDITAAASGTAVSWTGATLAGSSSIQIRVTDAAGNSGAAFGQVYSLDTTAPSMTISGVDFSSDTGTDGDFVTTTRVQTISATLSGSLGSGDLLMGSLDGGSTWTDVTSYVSGSSFSWLGVSLNQGTNQLRLLVTDVAGNAGDLETQSYELGGQIAVSRGSSSITSEASFNTDANVDIRFAWIGSSAGEAVVGTDANDFLALLGGDDAANGGAGNDVLDGGTGSNFLIGGAGVDRFFVDARGGQITWSTIGDFDLAAGEEVSLWGWRDGVSRVTWVADDGARGWTGVTMHADIDGNGVTDTSITWTGLDFDDLPVPLATASPDGTQLLWFF